MKKRMLQVLCVAVCLITAQWAIPAEWLTVDASAEKLPARVGFATQRVGTSNNAIATGLCKVASEHSGMLVVAQPTTGTPSWITPLGTRGRPELGFGHIFDIWWGYSGKVTPVPLPGDPLGTKPIYPASPKLRVLAAGPENWVAPLARTDAPFKTLREAKGKRLAGGYAAHVGAYSCLLATLANNGLNEDDFKTIVVPSGKAGMSALTEGRVDLTLAAIGSPGVTEANARLGGVRFLPCSTAPEDVKAFKRFFPGASIKVREPGPTGIAEPTPVMAFPLMVTTSTHLPDNVAYALVKAWWENYKKTATLHPSFKFWSTDNFVIKNTTVPYHPGAIAFYKEVGAWNAEMDTVQERLLNGEYPFLE